MSNLCRSKKNRRRCLAIQYTGENINDIANFLEDDIYKNEVGNIVYKGLTIQKTDYLVREYFEISRNKKVLKRAVKLYNEERFNILYRRVKKDG